MGAITPRHTPESVAAELIRGLEDGTIFLRDTDPGYVAAKARAAEADPPTGAAARRGLEAAVAVAGSAGVVFLLAAKMSAADPWYLVLAAGVGAGATLVATARALWNLGS